MERLHVLNGHFSTLEPNETGATIAETYDYIVVGGGSAGAIVASRLSEDPNVTVLLLEAGGEDNRMVVNTPGLYSLLQLTDVDWQFKTEPQPKQNNRVSFWPRGKVLGGCSSINAMLYVRGDKENYDSWERDGCTGWGYESMLPIFKKSENCQMDDVEEEYHGKNGPIPIVHPVVFPVADQWIKAGVEAGIPYNKDYNGKSMIGISHSQSNIWKGIRQNTSRVFLSGPRKNRKNLTVATLSYVTKVLFQGNTAIGVQYRRGSQKLEDLKKVRTEVVFCRKEVILSGGAVNTPWLLQLSGVGPKQELEQKGIPVVADLPVGKNLQDHLFAFLSWRTTLENINPTPNLSILFNLAQHVTTRTGLFAHCVLQSTAFLNTGLRNDGSPAPDLQIHFVPGALSDKTAEQAGLNNTPFWEKTTQNWGSSCFTAIPTLLRPKSVGFISLRSADPFDYPIIQPNYFTDPEEYDLNLLVEGFKVCRKIAKQQSLAPHVISEVVDTTIRHPPESDEYIKEYLRKAAITVYHPVGTCKMGRIDDPTTVVDPTLKIKGLKGIRVADASICPNIVSANTNAIAIAIGEKAAELIKSDWKK